jgi:hypothetical protein
MITNIGNRHENIIIKIRIIIIYNRSDMLRGRYCFLSPFTPLLLLLLLLTLLTLSFKRERLERHFLHIIWFADRNNRRYFGGFLLFVNKIETKIIPVKFG